MPLRNKKPQRTCADSNPRAHGGGGRGRMCLYFLARDGAALIEAGEFKKKFNNNFFFNKFFFKIIFQDLLLANKKIN